MNPVVALIIANIIWGAAAPIFKLALTNIPPFTLAFLRFFLASFLYLPFLKNSYKVKLDIKDLFGIVVAAFFGITINISFFFLGIKKTASINAPIIASTGPLLIFIFSIIFLKERPRFKTFFGMVISFLGALVIIFSPIIFDGKTLKNIGAFEGNLFLVIATIGAVIHPLVLKNILKKINMYLVTYLSFIFASLTFLPFMINELNNWSFFDLRTVGVVGIIFGVILSSGIAFILFNYGLSKIKAQEIGIFTYIDPFVAIILAIPLVGEYPNLYFLIGSLLIFSGIFIAEGRIHYHPIHWIKNFTVNKAV